MVTEVNLKNTRNDILTAYHEALEEIKTLKQKKCQRNPKHQDKPANSCPSH